MAASIVKLDRKGNKLKTINVSTLDITPHGITFDGKNIIFVGRNTNKIYTIDFQGKLLRTITPGGTRMGGIFHDGKNLHIIQQGPINDRDYFLQIDRDGKVIREIPADGFFVRPNPICTDMKEYWKSSNDYGHVGKWNKDGIILLDVPYVLGNEDPSGITYDGKHLWFLGRTTNELIQTDINITVIRKTDISGIGLTLGDICFDQKNFWISGY